MTLQQAIHLRDLILGDLANASLAMEMSKAFDQEAQALFYQMLVKDLFTINHFLKIYQSEIPAKNIFPDRVETLEDLLSAVAFLKYTAKKFTRVSKKCRLFLQQKGFINIMHSHLHTSSKEIAIRSINKQFYLCFGMSADGLVGRCMAFQIA